ncbi:kinase-like protein [Atractiella rhizophila]|nr:kinase-like protein [Atractiella rhizophila]
MATRPSARSPPPPSPSKSRPASPTKRISRPTSPVKRDPNATPTKSRDPFSSTPPVSAKNPFRPAHAKNHSVVVASEEPTMSELLSQQNFGNTPGGVVREKERERRSNEEGVVSWRKGQGFRDWEKEIFGKTAVRRKADLANLYFYDYYFDLLSYLHSRQQRLSSFHQATRQLSDAEREEEWASYTGRERAHLRKRRTKLKLDAFHIVCQVGQGGYGEIFLAKQKESGEIVALKRMRKKTLAKMDEIRHVLTERDILSQVESPWLVRLLYAFQDPTYIYLAMDFIAGGDFRTLLNNAGVLKEEHARFYISEMIMSVAELHKLGYIHRDLKPENFLIDRTGHIKLTDFGLAAGALNPGKIDRLKDKLEQMKEEKLVFRSTMERKTMYMSMRQEAPRSADSVVGSPDYMAIDTIRGQSYDHSVDYWSLGCILFEFLAGYPPFSGATPEETWNNLKNWQRALRRPHYEREEDKIFNMSDNGWDAITAFIASKETRVRSLDEVKRLAFFDGVPWSTLRDTPAPFVPELDSEVDPSYFDDFSSEADLAKYAEVKEKQRNVDKIPEVEQPFNRGVWVGFTFKSKNQMRASPSGGEVGEWGLMPPRGGDGREFEEDELEALF